MGSPACRISDETAHGGIVTVGFPTVVIGGLPASRIGDLHTCPMVDGTVPHVGGPFILGSPTVIVGEMPQSRVGDELVCVGPPDAAITGEFTVLVGMAGAGGAAGAGAGVGAMGVPVPAAAAGGAAAQISGQGASQASQQPTSQRQADGTVATSAPEGQSLPPVTLKQPGWPDLPPENTAAFASVQPANVLPGTTLYAAAGADATGGNSYWSVSPPAPLEPAGEDAAWNPGTHLLVHAVPPGDGIRAWAGKGAEHHRLQVWTPPGAVPAEQVQRFRHPQAPAHGHHRETVHKPDHAVSTAKPVPAAAIARLARTLERLEQTARQATAACAAGPEHARWVRACELLLRNVETMRTAERAAAAGDQGPVVRQAGSLRYLARCMDGYRMDFAGPAWERKLAEARRLLVLVAWQVHAAATGQGSAGL